MTKTREDFKPDVGGFLDGVSGDIVDAEFAIASGQYADKVMLGDAGATPPVVLTLTVESPGFEKPINQSFSVGAQDQWEIAADGKSVTNKNPDKRSFRRGSRAMDLVEAMITAVGDGDVAKGQDFFIKRDHYMTEAGFYIGTSWDWVRKNMPTVSGTPTPVPLPVKMLGETIVKGKPATKKAEAVEDDALDKILTDNASGKKENELKSFAVRNVEIKKNEVYMRAVVSGKKLKELEDSGSLTMDPTTKTYL